MGATHCPMGHDLHWASLMAGLLNLTSEGAVSLGRLGEEWLDEHGRPGPAWHEDIAAGSKPLRDWQVAALAAWSDHGRHGVVQAVTGTGKSRVGVEAIREALTHDFSVVVAVPTVDLVDQWVRALRENGVTDVGALADGQKATFRTHSVIVGTVQSLYQAPPERADGKVLLVADECHRYGAGEWRRVLHPTYRRRLGLTATFERNDDGIHELLRYFGGRPVYEIGFPQAIAEGVVAHYDVKLLGVPLTVTERAAYTEADQMLRDARMQLLSAGFPSEPFGAFLHAVQEAASGDLDPTVEDVARRYLKAFATRIDIMTGARAKLDAATMLAPKVQSSNGAILFTRRVDVAEEMASLLKDEGVRAEAVHSALTRHERRDRLTDLKVGRLKALVAPTVLDEGIDVPNIDLAVVLGGSKSRRQMIQRMGRVLRLKPNEGKATFIVVYATNTVEDLNQHTGVEGCLDLIIEAADSVEDLASIDCLAEPIQADGAEVTKSSIEIEPCAPVAEPATADADAELKVEVSMTADARLVALDPWSLPMTRRALNDYQRFHGGTDDEVDFALRDMLRDLQAGCHVRDGNSPGVFVARHSGFALALAADRFVAYTTNRGKSVTWATRLDYEVTTPEAAPAPPHDVVDPPVVAGAPTGEESVDVDQVDGGLVDLGPIEQGQIASQDEVRPHEMGHHHVTAEGAALQASVGDRLVAHLDRLVQLREAGYLSDREFAAAKEKLLF
jgi:superfamily II DNA or RNA helicase